MLKEDKNKKFFANDGERGVTSSSATHICNVAKEVASSIMAGIDGVSFVNTTVSEMTVGTMTPIEVANPLPYETIEAAFEKVGKLHGLIAWLKEGVKAKEEEKELLEYSFERACSNYDQLCIHFNEKPIVYEANKIQAPNLQEGINSLTVKERARMLYLEALASSIGKYIHKDGAFNKAITIAKAAKSKPSEVKEIGKKPFLYTYTTVAFDEQLSRLQAMHRSVEAELNGLKSKVEKVNTEVRNAYQRKMSDETVAKHKFYKSSIEPHFDELKNRFVEEFEAKSKFIKSLKIVIPKDLEDVYLQLTEK